MNINLELYKVFYHVAETQSFSHAAERLFVTQSAVSQAIKNLESQLHVPLFFRKTRRVGLTPEGKLLMAHVEQAINYVRIAESKIQEIRNLQSGEIHIGVSDTICKYFLLPVLAVFNQRYPQVKIRVVNRTSPQIVEILRKGEVDLGVITLPLGGNQISILPFLLVEDIFVAAERFSQLKKRRVALTELRRYPLLLLERGSGTRSTLDAHLRRLQIEFKAEIELESVDLLVQFAEAGLGIAHVLRESVAEQLRQKRLFEVKTRERMPTRQLGIVTLPQVPLSQAAQRLIELLQQERSKRSRQHANRKTDR
jgi:DNA-binding transcriptional LysR family regulator